MRRTLPDDPNALVVNWTYRDDWQLVVWEDSNEIFPWCLRWTNELTGWHHEETFTYVADALIRAGVITHAVETDSRLVQTDLGAPPDRRAFEYLAHKLLGFTSAQRSSTALPHHVRR